MASLVGFHIRSVRCRRQVHIGSNNGHKKKKSTYKRQKHYSLVTEGSDSTVHSSVSYTATLILLFSIPHYLTPDQVREKKGEIKGMRRHKRKKKRHSQPSSLFSLQHIFYCKVVPGMKERRRTSIRDARNRRWILPNRTT